MKLLFLTCLLLVSQEGSATTCDPEFPDAMCETNITCPCLNGGTCLEGMDLEGPPISCLCAVGFTGMLCEVDITCPCLNEGTCLEGMDLERPVSCLCAVGFTGTMCEVDINFCNATTCQNSGICVEGAGPGTSCTCPIGYTGGACQIDMDFCETKNCHNGGTCTEGEGTLTSCICLPGFVDGGCETDLDYCTPTTCQNGGTCVDGTGDITTCVCQPGFSGDMCQSDLDFCSPSTCENGGTCFEKIGLLTSCSCRAGFEGESCELDLNFCQPGTCTNGGMCLEGRGTFTTCACAPGYVGHTCETDMNYCLPSTCRNGGTCVEGPGRSTSCLCPQDITGPTCSTRIDTKQLPCPAETDRNWMLSYVETQPGETVTHMCSEIRNLGTVSTGMTSRLCFGDGEWGEVDTFGCRQQEIQQVAMEAEELFSREVVDAAEVEGVLEVLVMATTVESAETPSQFPQDLATTSNIIDMTVDFLMQDLSSNPDNPIPLSTSVVEVIDNILEPNNEAGWQAFAENEVGSEMILSNAENYGQYFAQALMNGNVNTTTDISETMAIARDNIVVQAQFVDQNNVDAILFPEDIDPNQRSAFGSAQSILSRSFLIDSGALDFSTGAVNIRMDNINTFLPNDGLNSTVRPATSIMATQLVTSQSCVGNCTMLQQVPVSSRASFRFTTKEFRNGERVSDPLCAFWKFTDIEADGFWSQEGMSTEVTFYNEKKGTYDVICTSDHLTSFAVMLDVNMALSEVESRVLTIITYVGCTVSIIFLMLTILFFLLVIGKQMFTSVHYFIHLNLSIALLLGYVVFLAGVDTAVGTRIGCAFVAALLHYLFTAVFCWMLCEGIMLYLMLVVVFSDISRKWWLFLLLGWVPPIFIVAISVGIIHEQYGNDDYCWISVENPKVGAIWAFAVPMLIVILVNLFFLVAALCSLYRVKRSKKRRKVFGKKSSQNSQSLFTQLFIATVVLLPLLGLTWVFGLLSVNQQTTFFAWIFTILNAFQGLFIFIFHVLRNDKVWNKLCCKDTSEKTARSTSGTQRESSTMRMMTRYGVKPQLGRLGTTISFVEPATLEQVVEEERAREDEEAVKEKEVMEVKVEESVTEEKEGDDEELLDVDLDMFRDDSDISADEDEDAGKGERSKFKYTMTLNWMGEK